MSCVEEETGSVDFIRQIIAEDMKSGKFEGRVVTRFPPEPNGYIHIGHAMAIWLSYSIGSEEPGRVFHLRFDDTNPVKEEQKYIDSIIEDFAWLGIDYGEHLYFASDYFDQMYEYALQLIKSGQAFVCDLNADQIREYRGSLTEPGRESPCRNRGIAENLDLFERMRTGEFANGTHTLRARIDMAAPNLNMRDPVIYRILHEDHPRTGDRWCIYPMYDYAHCLEDSIEKITHSLCSLEFEDHRPLYDWYLDTLDIYHPQQIEFARVNVSFTVTSKRKLMWLVNEGHVSGWDDPRMPTVAGLRRRGYTPAAVRNFCTTIGVSKRDRVVDAALLEFSVREDLNKSSPRVMGVLNPLKVVIDNYPDDLVEELDAINNPEDASAGSRKVPFSRVLYIERDDFMEDAPKKFFRLTVGKEVRLRYAYFVTCVGVVKDEVTGEVMEIHCTYDPETRGGNSPDGRKVKGTIHWVSAVHAVNAEVRLYDRLFCEEYPDSAGKDSGKDYRDFVNPESLVVLKDCKVEPGLADAAGGSRFQFERLGYFCVDAVDSAGKENLVFNRTIALRDSWAKIAKKKR